jgi:uncharacterized protein
LAHVHLSLQKMIDGGIYDHIAGGLCRYSTDAIWLAPHFEKMLYDNALLVTTLSSANLHSKNAAYANTIKHTIQFVETELKNPAGCYYAALDADSEGEEGKFYTWQKQEIQTLLAEDTALFCDFFGVLEQGNWEQVNILAKQMSIASLAKLHNITEAEASKKIKSALDILAQYRAKRVRPGTDDKLLFNWNALWLQALCMAYKATLEESYLELAQKLAAAIETTFKSKEQHYFHCAKNGTAKIAAFLDDYSYYIAALIVLYEVSGEETYLLRSKQIQIFVDSAFLSDENIFYNYTPKRQKDVIVQKIEVYDGATAAANSVLCGNLAKLGSIFDNQNWLQQSHKMLAAAKLLIEKHPSAFANWACLALHYHFGINEICITGPQNIALNQQVLAKFSANSLFFQKNANSLLPNLLHRSVNEKNVLYLCRNFVCKNGVAEVEELFQQLEKEHFNIAFPQ